MLGFNPPLLNSATPWATTKEEIQALYDCPYTGAVTTRTSLLTGFHHDNSVHQYAFVADREPVTVENSITKIPVSISSLNTLGYSPLSLMEYLRIVCEIHSNKRSKSKPFIVSVTGQPEDIVECYERIHDASSKSSIRILMEVNLSCPNIVGKPPPAYSRCELRLYLNLLNEHVNQNRTNNVTVQVGIKTPPYTYQAQFDDLMKTLLECTIQYSRCPISFITATNTLGNSLILGRDNYPMINSSNGSGIGGLAGVALHPLALGNVHSLREILDKHDLLKEIAIIGVGGVIDTGGYKRMRSVGAEAVAIGTAFGFGGIKVFEDIFDEQGLFEEEQQNMLSAPHPGLHAIAQCFPHHDSAPFASNRGSSAGYVPKGSNCLDSIIPVTVTSNNRPWIAPRWKNNYEFIDFLFSVSSHPSAGFPPALGNNTVKQTGSYQIGATFCTPQKPGIHSNTVIVATHGLGFDRSYWNFPYEPEKYNFAQFAIDEGYSIFFYDRLGTGISSKLSGFDAQLPLEIAILSSLAKSVKAGSYITLPHPPTSLVLIGHSFGSWTSNGLIALEPDLASAVILTGYSLNPNGTNSPTVIQGFAPRIAHLQRPNSFATLDSGYLTTADIYSNINQFFKAPDYDVGVAAYAEENKSPFAIAEIVSLNPAFLQNNASEFKGAALVATGERDLLFCGGLCTEELLAVPLKEYFKGAKGFETYIQPGAGHGLALANNARDGFERIFDFLGKFGL